MHAWPFRCSSYCEGGGQSPLSPCKPVFRPTCRVVSLLQSKQLQVLTACTGWRLEKVRLSNASAELDIRLAGVFLLHLHIGGGSATGSVELAPGRSCAVYMWSSSHASAWCTLGAGGEGMIGGLVSGLAIPAQNHTVQLGLAFMLELHVPEGGP